MARGERLPAPCCAGRHLAWRANLGLGRLIPSRSLLSGRVSRHTLRRRLPAVAQLRTCASSIRVPMSSRGLKLWRIHEHVIGNHDIELRVADSSEFCAGIHPKLDTRILASGDLDHAVR